MGGRGRGRGARAGLLKPLVDAKRVLHFPAEAADVYDTSGAGDTARAARRSGPATPTATWP